MQNDNSTENLASLSDEELVSLASSGDDRAFDRLLDKYRLFVLNKSKSYFIAGADNDDIVQEGMIGLFKAVRDFHSERGVSFKTFADICITRQILTAVKNSTRQKHAPLNSYISLNKTIGDDESGSTLMDTIDCDININPESIMLSREKADAIESKVNESLSGFELLVLSYYLQGLSYAKISQAIGKDPKSVDNALQRIKKKLEKISDC
ncbi:MAG: RNA polymerase sporulation sigma factor SigH [Clostridia bacterium]|nr:RNA polymerase sporulation sigma factor SigH [Clostridia bacterium]